MMNTGSTSPTPKMNSAKGNQAMPEIGRSISTSGSTKASTFLLRPIQKPSGTAIAIDRPSAISKRVVLITA